MRDEKNAGFNWKEKLGIILRPKNITKTVLSAVPWVGSPTVEIQNQIEAHEVGQQLAGLSASDMALEAKLKALEAAAKPDRPPVSEWPHAAGEFLERSVDLAVVYQENLEPGSQKEVYKPVAHGCLIGKNEVITCREALELAQGVADDHQGRLVIIAGAAWYQFHCDPVDEGSGLVLCKLTGRDEERWAHLKAQADRGGMGKEFREPIGSNAKASLTPWVGQEIGFVHTGEAEDVMRGENSITKLQFDTTVVSHFRRPKEDGLKTFVTGVLPGRILRAGAAVFSRDGTLLGVIAETESYSSDAGRRGVVRSLLAHPRFRHLLKEGGKCAKAPAVS